jgi:hypothetical protein
VEASVTAFKLPKRGNSVEECEDAIEHSLEHNRFAIADGATESSFADRWAQSLVGQFVNNPPLGDPPPEATIEAWLLPQQMAWHQAIKWTELPWYAEEKARKGAFATFLGMEFSNNETLWHKIVAYAFPGDELVWTSIAVGDSCLFQVRRNDLVSVFPVEKAEDFNSRPLLFSSNRINNSSALKDVRTKNGVCKPGDRFFLATDAIAKWILTKVEAGEPPWETLLGLKTEAEFEQFTNAQRDNQSMRNDDTTLAIITWKETPKSQPRV